MGVCSSRVSGYDGLWVVCMVLSRVVQVVGAVLRRFLVFRRLSDLVLGIRSFPF